jgi:hypothetical protein
MADMSKLNVLPLVIVLIVGSAAIIPATAAPRNGQDAHAQAIKQRTGRASAQANCMRIADEMMYGAKIIQRKNFLRDCMMERGFR